ncbi:glutathione S-transferase [Amylostereum chailletii]|nr:glutathione S-transferase [Amylostereum chailletii]
MSSDLKLYTSSTPNGRKVTVYLEELKTAYGITYDIHQKEPWFISINPNGRIPVLTDLARKDAEHPDGFHIMESGAILLYLAQTRDTQHQFSFDPVVDPIHYSEVVQWVFFTAAGLGPMLGQLGYFTRLQEDVPAAKKRFRDETIRLLGVLDIRLKDRDYLAGPGRGKFTVADINAYPFVSAHSFVGLELAEHPNVQAWFKRVGDREAVKVGMATTPS